MSNVTTYASGLAVEALGAGDGVEAVTINCPSGTMTGGGADIGDFDFTGNARGVALEDTQPSGNGWLATAHEVANSGTGGYPNRWYVRAWVRCAN